MMAKFFTFEPRQGVEAVENVNGFIEGCEKRLHAFGMDLDFKSNQWVVTIYIKKDGKNRGKPQRVCFTFSNHGTRKKRTTWEPMAEPFLGFAKAKMRYDFGRDSNENHSQKMAALRALEKALVTNSIDGIPRVENVDEHALSLAANILINDNPGSAYQSGCHLESIATSLSEMQMVRTSLSWKNIIPKLEDLRTKISEEADQYRLKNIPSRAALRAIPQIYANSPDPRDIFISSLNAVMFSSPGRFNELFALCVNCEHIDHRPDGTEIYGLRWYVSKQGEPEIRKILKTMTDICKEALGRIRNVTEEARRMARWYKASPDKLYLPKRLEHLREKEYLRSSDLAILCGQNNSSKATEWAGKQGLEAIKVRPKGGIGASSNAYRFEDVERVVCDMLPEGFPIYDHKTGLTYGDALLLVPLNFFHARRGNWRCMFQVVGINTFNDQIGSGAKHGKGSIFSRNNHTEDDGSPIEVDTHDFRHYLSYLAKRKGVDQLVLALWAGRKRIADNKAYGDPLVAEKTKLLKEGTADIAESLDLIGVDVNDPDCPMMFNDSREILEIQYQYVHETRFGYCIHEYPTSPCQRRAQCLECDEHLCIKGSKEKSDRIRDEHQKAARQLELVEKAIAGGEHANGSKLHKYLKKRESLLGDLVSVLDDPRHPAGTKIQLTVNAADTPLKISVSSRAAFGDRDGRLLATTTVAISAATSTSPALTSGNGSAG